MMPHHLKVMPVMDSKTEPNKALSLWKMHTTGIGYGEGWLKNASVDSTRKLHSFRGL